MQTEQRVGTHRIIKLEAENVKRLRAVQITPEGHLINIGGRNGQGKTSLLDAIEMALGGGRSIPGKPIRDGEDSARIVLETDELVITRTFTQKGSYLKVANKDGAKFSNGQEVLDALIGKYSFDPLDFTRLDPKKQAETLRELVGIDTSELDARRAVTFSTRTDINRDIKRFQAALDRTPHHEGIGDAEKSAAEIIDAIEFANQNNAKFRNTEQMISACTTQISTIEEEISRLQAKLRDAMDQKSKALKAKSELSLMDTDELKNSLSSIEDHNRKVRENQQHATILDQLDRATQASDELTEEIEGIDAEKSRVIREASFPIEGLGFDDDNRVTYNGIPFDQASSAEQIRVSVSIGLALNPKLRLLLVRDGSLLDSDALALLDQLATQHDAQILCERVGEGKECQVIIEDGMVKGGAL